MNKECLLLFPWLIQFTMLEEESINTRMHTQQQSNKLCKAFASFLVLQSTLNLISSSLALTWEMFQSWLFCCNAHLSRSPPMQQQPPEVPGGVEKAGKGTAHLASLVHTSTESHSISLPGWLGHERKGGDSQHSPHVHKHIPLGKTSLSLESPLFFP